MFQAQQHLGSQAIVFVLVHLIPFPACVISMKTMLVECKLPNSPPKKGEMASVRKDKVAPPFLGIVWRGMWI